MEFVIFANGEVNLKTLTIAEPQVIIAADGGANHCLRLGIQPDILIGDLDSINSDSHADLEAAGIHIIRYAENKDETDLELAINYAVEHGATRITLYGILGGRWDMSFANVMLLAAPKYAAIEFHVISVSLQIFILRDGQTATLFGNPGDIVSVLPFGGDALGIRYSGLAWSLDHGNLNTGSPIGVSNRMLEKEATITLESGTLIIFHNFQETRTQSG